MAKFKATNLDAWAVGDEPQSTTSRYATSNSRKEAARRLLEEIDGRKQSAVEQYQTSNARYASKNPQNEQYDFEARMHSTKRAGFESEFSEVRNAEDYEQMNVHASNAKAIRRSGYEEANEGRETITDLAHKYFYSQGSGIFYDPSQLSSILVEREKARLVTAEAQEQRKLNAIAQKAAMEEKQQARVNSMFNEDSALAGWTTAELSKSRIRKTANEATSSSAFGIVDDDKIAKSEAMRQQIKQARENNSKSIKRAAVSKEEEMDAWQDYEKQRSATMQDRFSQSPVIRSLSKAMSD